MRRCYSLILFLFLIFSISIGRPEMFLADSLSESQVFAEKTENTEKTEGPEIEEAQESETEENEPISVKKAKVTLSTSSYTYNGKYKKPSTKVVLNGKTLKKGTDYTVTYKDNKNIGKATVVIKGKGGYNGTIKKTFTIKAKKGATFTVSKHKYKVTSVTSKTVAFTGISSSKTTKITIPSTVKYGGVSFKVTAVAQNALKNKAKVTSITLGKNVTSIGENAFYGCKKLKTITIESTKLKSVGSKAFKGINSKAKIVVPSNRVNVYPELLKNKGQGKKVAIVDVAMTTATKLQLLVAKNAENNVSTRPARNGYCAAWVSGVYEASGIGYPAGNAIDYWTRWGETGSTSMENIPVGAVVVGSGSGPTAYKYGHVGIYLGNGLVAENLGGVEIKTLEEWCEYQDEVCQGQYQGWIGWVWPFGRTLEESAEALNGAKLNYYCIK